MLIDTIHNFLLDIFRQNANESKKKDPLSWVLSDLLASGARLRSKGNSSLGGAGERSETEGVTPTTASCPLPQWGGIFATNKPLWPSAISSRFSRIFDLNREKTTLPHFVIYPPNRSSGLSRVLDSKWDRERLHPVAHWGGNCPALAELRDWTKKETRRPLFLSIFL